MRRTLSIATVASLAVLLANLPALAQSCAPERMPDIVQGLPLVEEVRTEHSVAAIYVGENEYYKLDAYERRPDDQPEPGFFRELLNMALGRSEPGDPACPYRCSLDRHLPEGVDWKLGSYGLSDFFGWSDEWEWYLHVDMENGWQDTWRKKDTEPPVYLHNLILWDGDEDCSYSLKYAALSGPERSGSSNPALVWQELVDRMN